MSRLPPELARAFRDNPDLAALNADLLTPARRTARTAQADSPLEARFDLLWIAADGPPLEQEYAFHDARKWRADRAHLASRTLIEVEGGTHSRGRHVRGAGYAADCAKYNAATMDGWRVIRLTSDMLQPDYVADIARWIEAL